MPTLPICDEAGRPLTVEGLVGTFAAMLYPDDEALREAFTAKALCEMTARCAVNNGKDVAVPPEVLLAALQAEENPFRAAEALTRAGKFVGRWYEGTVAGAQVEMVWALAHHAPQQASRRKAVYLMEIQATKDKRPGTKSQFGDIWSQYQPVAHLWAAFNTRRHRFRRIDEVGYTAWKDFEAFITEAEIYREWGENHYAPPKQKKRTPLLDPALTWKPPPNWVLTWHMSLGWPPPPTVPPFSLAEWMIEALADYPVKRSHPG